MQNIAWDDLRFLLAVYRMQTFSAAASYLGVDGTTVSRRLKSLERTIGAELFIRLPDSSLRLTYLGTEIVNHAECMEREAESIHRVLGEETDKIAGTVRVTSVPAIVNHLMVPSLPALLDNHPYLTIELVPDSRDLNLTRREADLAVRLARPKTGGTKVKTRKIGTLSYGVFASVKIASEDAVNLDWIAYDESMAHLPQSKWLTDYDRKWKCKLSGIRVTDAETAQEAAAHGIGKVILPMNIGQNDPRLQVVDVDGIPSEMEREVWLLSHSEQRNVMSVRTVIDWIETLEWSL